MIHVTLIHVILTLWFASQIASPQAAEHMQAGIAADKQRQFGVAITEYKKVTELDPSFADGFVSLGQAYMESGDYSSAIPPLKHALELNADSAPAHQLLGYALLAQGYAAEAVPHLQLSPDKTALGIAQIQIGQLPEAVTNLQAALAAHPNDPDILYYLGRASGLLAKQSIDTLLAAYPDSARAHQAMAENYFVLRRMPDAEKEYREALRLRPGLPEAHLALGEVYAGAFQWPKAEEEFRMQVKLQPGNAEAAYRLGNALLEQGKAHEARSELLRADRLLPDMPETLYALGKAASLEGDSPAAEKAWTKLLSIEKQSSLAAQAHFGLAGIYRKQGKTAEAKHEMQEFQSLQNNSAQPQPSRATESATLSGSHNIFRSTDMELIQHGFYRRLPATIFYLLGSVTFFALAAWPLKAAEPSSLLLNTGWQFRAVANADRSDVKEWHPAQVPGVVQTDLLNNKLIPDPFYGDNEFRLQWIGLADWEYQTTFQVDAATLAHEHLDLVFDGLDTFADVYLNDQPILHADNMFRRWRIPAKTGLKSGPNTLRIVFHSAVEKMIPYVKTLPYVLPSISTQTAGNEENIATAPYTRKAPYNYGWDWGPRYMTEGIWQPVRLEAWDALRIENFHIHQQGIQSDLANVSAELEIEASKPTTATLTLAHDELSGPPTSDGNQTLQLNAGMNHVSFPLRIAAPKLWYPVGYGAQNRYRFSASIRIGREAAAHAETKTGLRSVELRRVPDQWGKSFEFVVNGITVFAKGADVIPFDSFPNRVTPEIHRNILQAARDAHMNMVREWGGGYYESDDFYDICDELGIMVWQEFMFGGDMIPGDVPFQENVRQEAIDQIKRLRDHPSIVIWCGNNEVETGWYHWGDRQAFKESVSPATRERVWQDYVIMFADIIKSSVMQYADPTPYWPSSPSANFEEIPDNQHNGDMHYWAVWHAQAPASDYTLQFPRFMTEYGFQSFPEMRTIETFAKPEDFDIRSAVMQAHQKNKGGNERILTYMLREYRQPKDFASYVYLSQVQQAEIIKIGAEHLRRQRPRTMGSLYWQLNDCWPVASWASIDYYGRWKALHYYARRFYDDVLVSPFLHDDKVDVYVVSDKLQALSGTIHMRLLDFSGNSLFEQTKEVQVPAQSSAIYFSVDKATFAAKGDPHRTFLVFDLEVGGKKVSRNLIFFDVTHDLELPVAPKIETTFNKTGADYTVTLQSAKLARSVYLSFGDLDANLSDNYFDLLPGEPVTLTIKSTATLDRLQGAMKVMSLTEAYNPKEGATKKNGRDVAQR